MVQQINNKKWYERFYKKKKENILFLNDFWITKKKEKEIVYL